MVDKINDNLGKIENSEKLDLRNDQGYKLLEENFGKIKILNKNNKPVSKDNLLDFYKKIKKESFNQIDEVLKDSKSNVVKLFGGKEKFKESVFKEYLKSRIGDKEVNEKNFSYWKDYLSGLLELNYKSKEDFKNAFINFYLGKKEVDFIKDIWGNENISWQEAKKIYSIILFSFSSDEDFRNIKGKIKSEVGNLLERIDINDLPYFFDKTSHEYLKNYGLVDKDGRIDINVLLSLIGLVQNISDDIINQNLKGLNSEQKKDIITYSLLHLFPEKGQEFLKKELGTDNIVFLVKNLGIQNSYELLVGLNNCKLFKNQKGIKDSDIDSIIGKYSIFISEKNKGRFLDIIKKFDLDYSEDRFEASKVENIKKFIVLFTNSDFDKKKLEKNMDLIFENVEGLNNEKRNQIKKFLVNFLTGEGLNELKHKLYEGKINDPISYILTKLSSQINVDRGKIKSLYNSLYTLFTNYANKLVKKSKTETILSTDTFKKVEKDLELNSKGEINPYQASIVAYYACEYAVKNNNGKIDNNLLRKTEFIDYLKQKIGIKNKKENKIGNNRKTSIVEQPGNLVRQMIDVGDTGFSNANLYQFFSDNFLSNFSLSGTYEIDKKTLEELKQDQSLLDKIQEYKKMGYEGYIRYMEQIENEKKLLKETGGTISREIPLNEVDKSLLEGGNEVNISTKEIGGIYKVIAVLPEKKHAIEVVSLTKEDANKELLKELTKYQFGIKISFDNWTPDDFGKLIDTDITKGILTSKDLDEIKEFYQVYAINLLENDILPKDFLSKNGLELKDVYDNFTDFAKHFSEWMKNHMSIGGLKPIGTEFELDKFDSTVQKVLNEKYKWSEVKEKILDNQNDYGILEKAKGFIKKIWS